MKFNEVTPNVLRFKRYARTQTAKHTRMTYTYKMLFVAYGKIRITTKDGQWLCTEGDIIYIPAKYSYDVEYESSKTNLINIEFDMLHDRDITQKQPRSYVILPGRPLNDKLFSTVVTFDDVTIFNRSVVKHKIANDMIQSLMRLSEVKYTNKHYPLILNAKITELLVYIVTSQDTLHHSEHTIIAERILSYIKSHITERLSADSIASVFLYHKVTINRIIKEIYGCTLHQLILKEKIAMAENLMKNSKMSIDEVANYLGFFDSAHFSKVFQKITGSSPSKIRNQK